MKLIKRMILTVLNDIGTNAFGWCPALSRIDIRETKIVVLRGDSFGAGDQLKNLELPETIKLIEEGALNACSALETLVIHSDNIAVEDSAFRSCDSLNKIIFTQGKPSDWGDLLFSEIGAAQDGKSYISDSYYHRGEVIPYPTLYYTAAYADEWAPNGETEWNDYPIQQISQEELDAILAEARGENPSQPSATPAQTDAATAAPQITAALQEPEKAALSTDAILLLLAIAATAVAVVVVVIVKKARQ